MSIIHLPQDRFREKKEGSNTLIFHNYTSTEGSFKGKSILHTNAISLVISGEKTMHFANKTLYIKEDEFHLLSAGNCIASIKLSRNPFKSILIFFDDRILADFYLKYDALIRKIKGKQKILHESYLSFKKDPFVLNYIASLHVLFEEDTKISMEMKVLKFEELMLYLLERYPRTIIAFRSSYNKDMTDFEIRKAAEANISSNITLEELAFLCNISLSTFKRRFTKLYGTAPNKWFLQKKMERARDLLQHHKQKPSDVYHKVGYESHSSFSQAFKQTFGLSPKEFQSEN